MLRSAHRYLPRAPSRRTLWLLAALVAASTFALDLRSELGVAAAVPYVGMVLLMLSSSRRRDTWTAAVAGTVLTLVGYALSEPGESTLKPVANRLLAVGALWATALAVLVKQRLVHELRELKEAIDQACIVDVTWPDGRIADVNERFCELTGYDRGELIGEDHAILNSGHHPPEFMADLWETIREGEVWRGEIRDHDRAGKAFWVDTTIVPFVDREGRPERYLTIRTDITARKEAEARLREREALAQLGEMSAIVAHEVKNPLTGISGALQIIDRRLPEDASERRVIASIQSRIQSLDAAIQDLLTYARPREPRLRSVDMGSLVGRCASFLDSDERFTGVQVVADAQSRSLYVDPEQLSQALLNLLLNAAQALDGTGRIRVTARSEESDYVIRVADDGPGMPDDVRARVFQPFFTTRSRGTGLGLPTVRRTVEGHGGSVDIRCPEAGGTVACIRLPLPRRMPERKIAQATRPAVASCHDRAGGRSAGRA
ncbi:MAG: two-component system sensor histidine kinase NtrB [Myxococcota bacterium]